MALMKFFILLTFLFSTNAIAQSQNIQISKNRFVTFTFENDHLIAIENNLGRFTSVDVADLKQQIPFLNLKQKKLAQYILEMFPLDAAIPAQLEMKQSYNKEDQRPKKGWTMICNLLGQKNMGKYTDGNDQEIAGEGIVGDKTKRCFGRCGAGCVPYHLGTYTQECFNHDLCHRTTGENWGICKDEFMIASDGYIHAPRCKQESFWPQ